MIGQTLNNRYTITARLGKGAMGTVYRATDTHSGREVALKVISSELVIDLDMLERFKREGEALSKLKHPNIVGFIDAFQHDEQYVIVMEFVAGGSLHELISKGPLPIERANRIALELCDVLIRSHHLNIIHRDLKPENILIDEDGTPKLADFGVARLSEGTRMTRSGTQVGTPYYMAPEAWEGKILDAQADIWSLGVILFEMLTGQVPFGGDTGAAVMNKVLTTQPPDMRKVRADVPHSLVKIISSMLSRDRKRRYPTMRQLAADLELGTPSELEKRSSLKANMAVTRKPIWRWLGAAVILGLLLAAAVSFGQTTLLGIFHTWLLGGQPIAAASAVPTSNMPASQDNLLEDHFDTQKFDGSYNGLLWNCGGCFPELVFQQNGVFNINVRSSSEATGRDLSSIESWTFAQIGYIQARLKLENYEGIRHADVHAQLWADFQDYQWWTSCDVLMEPSSPSKGYFNCHVGRIYPNGSSTDDYSTPLIPINTNEWQAVRIEIEPETFRLKFYLNGELIGTRIPSDADILKAKTLTPIFGIWTEGLSSFTAHLDDLIVGST